MIFSPLQHIYLLASTRLPFLLPHTHTKHTTRAHTHMHMHTHACARTHTHQVLHSIPKPITASLNSLQGPKMIVQVDIPSLSLVLSPPTVRLILHVAQSLRPDKVCRPSPHQFTFSFLSTRKEMMKYIQYKKFENQQKIGFVI